MPHRVIVPLGLTLGWLADQALGDPRRGHPVAAFGRMAGALTQRTYADRRSAGLGHVGVLVGSTVAVGVLARGLVRPHPVGELVLTAAATWTVLGGRSLDREATAIDQLLTANDLPGARRRIRNLVGRDPSGLDAAELARACVESLAENTSDAVVAPLVWGAVAGIPGLLAYRAVNTLDAMIGHRSRQYRRFGWAAARIDDVANWLPARLSAVLATTAAPLVGGSPARTLATVRRDASQHPSPNAGVVESAFAGALGVRLGGINVYGGSLGHGGEAEDRGTLGEGRPLTRGDIVRARRLARAVGVGALVLAVTFRLGSERSPGR
ncbi:MAG: cobalamin biosynthesis protein [Propionibacteriaceae bacterium]